ncbi:MAG TPA: redoxin domain-containing protein [Thermoleophilaceae bacterium]|nr:redoxin domain-containing protein [Thermoleophilaceae bacterium]
MPDDRFGDLGAPDRRSAAERFEEQDRINPEPDDPRRRPEAPRPDNRYAWGVGIVMLMAIAVYAVTSSLPDSGEGLRGPAIGSRLPDFAAPSATGNADNGDDANVRQRSGGSAAAGPVPACQVVSPEVVNVCELRRKPLVLTFLVTRGADCEPQVDRVERMREEFPQVEFASVVSGNDREEVEQIVDRRGWTMPVAVDRDGAVVNLYGIGVCPTTVFSTPGGTVRRVELGNLTETQLRSYIRRLVARS